MANVERFEKFHRVNATSGGMPMVSIHLRGVFALNREAYEALGEPEAVELFKDRDEWVIGFGAALEDSPDSYKVRHHTTHSHQVAGKAFLEFYGVPKEMWGRRYKAERLPSNMISVDLTQSPEDQ
jgi:hypothetical protein